MPPKTSTNDSLDAQYLLCLLTSNNKQAYNQINKYQPNQPTPTKNPNQSSWVTVDAPARLPATAEAAAPAPRAENKSLWLPNPPHLDLTHFTHHAALARWDGLTKADGTAL
ncbi:hypothetical protein V496_05790 [Pseudogymnoascus sp. VKM F-4515 (FW-2607)]|nr:hypothetical protein V496_05790 [Pseudogymnoascus sp. VKM F-4515 (FW-2607)]KFY96874.1 hypothetical protein V498_02467 [Pseudogymnoascus sp. VKM F-4517 (FW-2822)]